VRPDDPSILGGAWLLRALPFEGWYKIEEGGVRATSIAFTDRRSGEVSCYLDTPERRRDLSKHFPGCYLARFTADQARECGFNVTSAPDTDPQQSMEHIVLTFAREGASNGAIQRAAKMLALRCEVIRPVQH
jgi:hypothetical protein